MTSAHALTDQLQPASAEEAVYSAFGKSLAPRASLTVSAWADLHRILSPKDSPEPGQWRTDRNPPSREIMDCFSARSPVQDVVCMLPIQYSKTQCALNVLGYTMAHDPGPVMVCLPGEVSMNKWVAQKLNPLLEESPAVRETLVTLDSRKSANQRFFKDFAGGQLFIEHAGSPQRLKSSTVRTLIVDELDEFAASLTGGDDPLDMLQGRTSAFPGRYKRLYISTPGIQGISRTEYLWLKSDMRRYYVPCPHCGHRQHLEWSGLSYVKGSREVWYLCQGCGEQIHEHHKPQMLAAGQWVAEHPERKMRGYHINALYYPIGLGPRWADLVDMWLEAQGDNAKLKTFVNDRLAETWADPAMRSVQFNAIADRAEPYPLREAQDGVLAITAGVDTQDDRLEVHIVGWGEGMRFWTLDYVVLPGDPALDDVWVALTDLLNRPIVHAPTGSLMPILATAQDAGGHRTEDVKAFVRRRLIRRPLAIFGAKANNAPILGKGKLADVNWRNQADKRGVHIHQVGTVAAKHWLYSRLATDATAEPHERACHFSQDLDPDYFRGLVSETYNPVKNRFEKKRGVVRNEPLDTWVYAFAAAHHPELRLHRHRAADWQRLAQRLQPRTETDDAGPSHTGAIAQPVAKPKPRPRKPTAARGWGKPK